MAGAVAVAATAAGAMALGVRMLTLAMAGREVQHKTARPAEQVGPHWGALRETARTDLAAAVQQAALMMFPEMGVTASTLMAHTGLAAAEVAEDPMM